MMTARLARLVALTLLVACSLVGADRDHSSFSGRVEDRFANPVPTATVTLISLERVLQTDAASDGSFVFSDIPWDAYEIEIVAPGFAKQKLTMDLRKGFTIPPLGITLHPGSIPDMETCGPHSVVTYGPEVESSHRLTGFVHTYDHNKPLVNANVTLRRIGEDGGEFGAISDKRGKYVFENVPVGRYTLQVSRRGYATEGVRQLVMPRLNEVFVHTTILGGNKLVVCQ